MAKRGKYSTGVLYSLVPKVLWLVSAFHYWFLGTGLGIRAFFSGSPVDAV
jgi:hypothetical protein